MNENEEIKKLEKIKYSLRKKEKIILKSQIEQNKIENQLKRLENIRNNIINNKKNILSKIITFILYDIVMISIMLLLIHSIINKFTSTPLLVASVYAGVLSIGICGAYISSVIEEKTKKYYNKKKLKTISEKIKEKKQEIKLEIDKQYKQKNEITKIINGIDVILPEVNSLNNNYKNIIEYDNKKIYPKIRSKSKYNKNH